MASSAENSGTASGDGVAPERQSGDEAGHRVTLTAGGMPPPVARYLQHVLREGQPLIRTAHLMQRGQFRMAPGAHWSTFRARQFVTINPPGFAWKATIHRAPLVNIRVRDSYGAGKGSMRATLFRILPVMKQSGHVQLNIGALQRFLAEAAWYPTTLLPGPNMKWTPVNDQTANATLQDGSIETSLHFKFNESGEIEEVSTPARYRFVRGRYGQAPWRGRYRSYREIEGFLIPTEAEVEWMLPEGIFTFYKGTVVTAEYNKPSETRNYRFSPPQ